MNNENSIHYTNPDYYLPCPCCIKGWVPICVHEQEYAIEEEYCCCNYCFAHFKWRWAGSGKIALEDNYNDVIFPGVGRFRALGKTPPELRKVYRFYPESIQEKPGASGNRYKIRDNISSLFVITYEYQGTWWAQLEIYDEELVETEEVILSGGKSDTEDNAIAQLVSELNELCACIMKITTNRFNEQQ